jgi:hypothetical protein
LIGNLLGGFATQSGQNVANTLTGHGLIPRRVMYNNHPHWVVHGDGIGSWLSKAMGTLRLLLSSTPVRRVGGVALGHVANAFQDALASKIEDLSNRGAAYGRSHVDNLTKNIPFVGDNVKNHLYKGVDEIVRRGREAAVKKANEAVGRVRSVATGLQRPAGRQMRDPDFAQFTAKKRAAMAPSRTTLKAPNSRDQESEDDDIYEDAVTGHGLRRRRVVHNKMCHAKKRRTTHPHHLIY